MTVEQKDKILTTLTEVRNSYVKECEKQIAELQGRMAGAYYMVQRMDDIIRIEYEVQEND